MKSSGSRSNENINLVPYPNSDWTKMAPLNSSTIFLQMNSPKPTPCVFICLVFWRVPNILKRPCISFLLMPTPVSSTDMTTLSFSPALKSCLLFWFVSSSYKSSISLKKLSYCDANTLWNSS